MYVWHWVCDWLVASSVDKGEGAWDPGLSPQISRQDKHTFKLIDIWSADFQEKINKIVARFKDIIHQNLILAEVSPLIQVGERGSRRSLRLHSWILGGLTFKGRKGKGEKEREDGERKGREVKGRVKSWGFLILISGYATAVSVFCLPGAHADRDENVHGEMHTARRVVSQAIWPLSTSLVVGRWQATTSYCGRVNGPPQSDGDVVYKLLIMLRPMFTAV